jgi:hypothetical protein
MQPADAAAPKDTKPAKGQHKPLTDAAVKNAKPASKAQKMYDKKGLLLFVHPNGGKYWRMKFRFAGKEKELAFGAYPAVSLKEARERRDA